MKKVLSIFFLVFLPTLLFSQSFSSFNGKEIISGKIIVKFKPSTALKSSSSTNTEQDLDFFLKKIGATKPQQKFPIVKIPENCEKCTDISKIYEFYYTSNEPLEDILLSLNNMDCIEYAEPSYVAELLYTPNDTEFSNGNLWHLSTCKILDAWDVEQGDSTVVIGIVDGGIDIIQKDLINKIAYNTNDPINGIDDDGDGYTDNYRGWDTADDDNNPTSTSKTEHGTYVSGIASGEVDNEFGTAGVGFKTKFLPIKACPNGTASITAGYEGVIYAANQGCKVINCSWGDTYGSQFGKDAIYYATYNCDALVIAAAGNSASTELYYPASYPEVLSVGGTAAGDLVWADTPTKGSHYNQYIDICAPAKDFYSIANSDKTIAMSGGGTSFAAPIASGAAALVRSKYPEYSALQTAQLLRVSADDIYEINSEAKYKDMLGKGRLNVYKALTNNSLPGVRISNVIYENARNQPYTFVKDTVFLYVTFKNILHDATNISIKSVCDNSIFSPILTDTTFEAIAENEEVTCKFAYRTLITPPVNYEIYFKFSYSGDNSYSDFEYFPIKFNSYCYDFEIGNIKSSATFDGSIAVYSTSLKQNGFSYKNSENCIYQGGLILAENQHSIYSRTQKNADFESYLPPTILQTDSCDLAILSSFYKKNLYIEQLIYGWENTDALIYQYTITNERDSALYNFRLGMFIDWNVLSAKNNQIWYVDSLQLTIATNINPRSFYVGLMPLDYNRSDVYAFNLDNDAIYYKDGFNRTELWYALNNSQKEAGTNTILGADIAAFNYSIIDTLPSKDSVKIYYAMIAADSQEELFDLAYQLKQQYNPTIVIPDTIETEPSAAAQLFNQKDVKLCNKDNVYTIEYLQSTKDIQISQHSIEGQLLSAISISPENQTGEYRIPYFKGIQIISVKNEFCSVNFKIVQQ
ncbi:MAG: S8 family serine peptidase [Bacteroidales bacterium]|nr:S8 family serine peptidase [Bacteroidales bacterium]